MKAAVAALLVIACIIAAVSWNAQLTQDFYNRFSAADSIIEKKSIWESERFRLHLTLNRKLLHSIESALAQMEIYKDSPASPEFIAAKSALELTLENIKILESFSGAP